MLARLGARASRPRVWTIAILLALSTSACAQTPQPFRAGAARRDITPREPVPMWGYGARHDQLSQGTLDPLYADALVLDAAGRKLAIVGLDLGRSPSERSLENIRRRIRDEAGIEHSFIAGSHTHHGPVLELLDEDGKGRGKFDAAIRYYRELENAIVQAVSDANSRLAPARVGVGSAQLEGFNRNRHTKVDPKAIDRELAVMRVDAADSNKPIAVLVNFAAHPTMVPASSLKFSADFVGSLKNAAAEETGAAVIFMQGAGGDQSASEARHKGHEAFGEALGGEAAKLALRVTTAPVATPALEVREERITFVPRTDLTNPLVRAAYNRAFFPELVATYVDEYAQGIRPRLTVALLNGDIAMVGVSGEFFSAHAMRLKERARVRQLFFFGYANGYHQYYPTIEAVAEGGYGADAPVAPAAVGAGEQMMNTALVWLYRMLGKGMK